MDRLEIQTSHFDLDDPVTAAAARAEWLEIVRAVSAAVPDQASDAWLGQLVLEVQQASDRALAAARDRGDILIANARTEALAIREAGRRRSHAIRQLRRELDEAVVDSSASAVGSPAVLPLLPLRAIPTSRRPDMVESTGPGPLAEAPDAVAPPAEVAVAAPSSPEAGAATRQARPDDTRLSGATPISRPRAHGGLASPGLADVRRRVSSWITTLRRRPAAVLAALGIVTAVLGLGAFESYGTAGLEQSSQSRLAAQLAKAEPPRPVSTRPDAGTAFGLLSVPRLGITGAALIEGASVSHLREGPAHDANSQLPGQKGAVVLIGRSHTYGAPFGRIGALRPGDVISLRTRQGLYVYRVRRAPEVLSGGRSALQLPVADRSSGGATADPGQALILATGTNLGGTSMEVVVATLDQASVAPGLSPTGGGSIAELRSVPGERIGLILAVLWVAIGAGAIYLGRRVISRFPAALVYVAISLVVLVAVGQVYLSLDRLLPGTY